MALKIGTLGASGQPREQNEGRNLSARRLPSCRRRTVHERAPARIFPAQASELEGRTCWQRQRDTIEGLQDTRNIPDIADRASEETDRALELRTRDRQRKLVAKIDAALRRIDEGEYGYCEVTGEPISLKRLDARPIATLSLEAQERHERREKVHRDD
jgi:RNA polymerase-binding protein DksA